MCVVTALGVQRRALVHRPPHAHTTLRVALPMVVSSPLRATRRAEPATATVVEPTEVVAIVAMLVWQPPCPTIHLLWVRVAARRVWVNLP